MESIKQQWGHRYGKYLAKVCEVPPLRSKRTARVNSIDQLFQDLRLNSEQVSQDVAPQRTDRKLSVKKLDPIFPKQGEEYFSPKRRSVSLAMKKFKKHQCQQEELSFRAKRDKVIKDMANQIEEKLQKQTLQLKKLELHRVHVSQILSSMVNSTQCKEIKDLREITSRERLKMQEPLLTGRKEGTVFDPQKYHDLYHKIPQAKDFHLPSGPLLSFRQFAKQQGMRLPKFLE